MPKYVCTNCGEEQFQRRFSVPYVKSRCGNPECDFEPHANIDELPSILDILGDKISVDFREKHVE